MCVKRLEAKPEMKSLAEEGMGGLLEGVVFLFAEMNVFQN